VGQNSARRRGIPRPLKERDLWRCAALNHKKKKKKKKQKTREETEESTQTRGQGGGMGKTSFNARYRVLNALKVGDLGKVSFL